MICGTNRGRLAASEIAAYDGVRWCGDVLGVFVLHLRFLSARDRSGKATLLGAMPGAGPEPGLAVRGDHRAPRDLALAEQLVRLAGALEREVLDQHLDLSGLGERDDVHELADRAPVR